MTDVVGTTLRARDLRHDRSVALRVLRPELAATLDPDRFLREIRLTAPLDHPYILLLVDCGEAGGLLWCADEAADSSLVRRREQFASGGDRF